MYDCAIKVYDSHGFRFALAMLIFCLFAKVFYINKFYLTFIHTYSLCLIQLMSLLHIIDLWFVYKLSFLCLYRGVALTSRRRWYAIQHIWGFRYVISFVLSALSPLICVFHVLLVLWNLTIIYSQMLIIWCYSQCSWFHWWRSWRWLLST